MQRSDVVVAYRSEPHQALAQLRRVVNRIRRLSAFLYMQRISGFPPPTDPHLDRQTASRLREELGNAKFYLEYGSGGSTLMAAQMGVRTVSVESDRFCASSIKACLGDQDHIEFLTPPMGITAEWGRPIFWAELKGPRYVEAPFAQFGTMFPDLVLIDGRYRAACALEVARRAHEADARSLLIFDDYVERPQYHVVEASLGRPEVVGRSALFRVGHTPVKKSAVASCLPDPL